jgi:hypothetical protein
MSKFDEAIKRRLGPLHFWHDCLLVVIKRLLIWQLLVSKACMSYILYGIYMHI